MKKRSKKGTGNLYKSIMITSCVIILRLMICVLVSANTANSETLRLNSEVTGHLQTVGDIQRYDFSIENPGSITVDFELSSSIAEASCFVDLYDSATSRTLYLNRGNAVTDDSSFLKKRLPAGSYYIEIRGAQDIQDAAYTLKVNYKEEDPDQYENENNDSFVNANLISTGQNITGNIDDHGDKDIYKFKIVSKSVVQVYFAYPSSSDASWTVCIYDSDGELKKSLGSTGDYPSREIYFDETELQAGDYYLEIETASSSDFFEENADEDYTFQIIVGEATAEPSPSSRPSNSSYICSDWAADEIEEAGEKGLIPDTLEDEDLTESIDRSEFAAIAVELYQVWKNYDMNTPQSVPFRDIDGTENEDYIKKAYVLNITNGTSSTSFSPYTDINREQLATMLARTVKKIKFADYTIDTDHEYYFGTWSVKKFDDDDLISAYAKDSVYFLADRGVIKGTSTRPYLFSPNDSNTRGDAYDAVSNAINAFATREQAVIMSLRIFNDKPDILDEVYAVEYVSASFAR